MLSASAALAAVEAGPLATTSDGGFVMPRVRSADREIPFRPGEVWTGSYYCPQGTTELDLEIESVNGNEVTAVFSFRHPPTGVAGRFELQGPYQPSSRRLHLEAGEWISQPLGYDTVDMEGFVDASNAVLTGRIVAPGCGPFALRRR
jgi:hypothetical protein